MGAPHEDAARSTYDTVADAYADHFPGTEPEQPLDLAVVDHFVSLVPEPRRVLDAGCGAGRMMPYLAARGCSVEGVDLSPGMIRRARLDHPEFAAQVATLTALPHADGSFDGVLSWYSTIHSPDDDLPVVLGELRRVLRPGGVVLLGFQSGDGVREVGDGYRARGFDVRLDRWSRRPEVMEQRCAEAGLVPVALVRRDPVGGEKDGQGFVVARRRG